MGSVPLAGWAAQWHVLAMTASKRLIEVDETTAATLERRAAERGLSVASLIAEMTAFEGEAVPPDETAELDRRWALVTAGEVTIPHEDVVQWLQTWGTPSFRSWNSR